MTSRDPMLSSERTAEEYKDLFQSSNRFEHDFNKDLAKVSMMSWNCSGDVLGVASGDTVALLDFADNTLKKSTSVRAGSKVDFLHFHPTKPHILATLTHNKTVKLWNTKDAARPLFSHNASSKGMCFRFSPSGEELVVVTLDNVMTVLSTSTGKVKVTRSFHEEVNEFEWDITGEFLFLCTGGGYVVALVFATLESAHFKIKANATSCRCLTIDKSKRIMAAGGVDSIVSIIDAAELVCPISIPHYDALVKHVYLSSNGDLLSATTKSSRDNIIVHTGSGDVVFELGGKDRSFKVDAMAWHPSKIILAYEKIAKHSGSSSARVSLVGLKDQ